MGAVGGVGGPREPERVAPLRAAEPTPAAEDDPIQSLGPIIDTLVAIIDQLGLWEQDSSVSRDLLEKIQARCTTIINLFKVLTGPSPDDPAYDPKNPIDFAKAAADLKAAYNDLAALQQSVAKDSTLGPMAADFQRLVANMKTLIDVSAGSDKPIQYSGWYDGFAPGHGRQGDLAALIKGLMDPKAMIAQPGEFFEAYDNLCKQIKLAPANATWLNGAKDLLNRINQTTVWYAGAESRDSPFKSMTLGDIMADPPQIRKDICDLAIYDTPPGKPLDPKTNRPPTISPASDKSVQPPIPNPPKTRGDALRVFSWFLSKYNDGGGKIGHIYSTDYGAKFEWATSGMFYPVNGPAKEINFVGVNNANKAIVDAMKSSQTNPTPAAWMEMTYKVMQDLYVVAAILKNPPNDLDSASRAATQMTNALKEATNLLRQADTYLQKPTFFNDIRAALNNALNVQVGGRWLTPRNDRLGSDWFTLGQVFQNPNSADLTDTKQGTRVVGGKDKKADSPMAAYLLALTANMQNNPPWTVPGGGVLGKDAFCDTCGARYNLAQSTMNTAMSTLPGGLESKLMIINYIADKPTERSGGWAAATWTQWTNVYGMDLKKMTGSITDVIGWTNTMSNVIEQKTDAIFQQMLKAAQAGMAMMQDERSTASKFYRKMGGE
jgi:hypothetical protein